MCAFIVARCVHTQHDTYLFIEFGFLFVAFVCDASSLVVENFMKNDDDFLYWIQL